jgi:hypothetical protein
VCIGVLTCSLRSNARCRMLHFFGPSEPSACKLYYLRGGYAESLEPWSTRTVSMYLGDLDMIKDVHIIW